MKNKGQVKAYIIADFLTASFAWFLFNFIRYKEIASFLGFSTFNRYLTYSTVLEGQVFIPLIWIAIYYFSGYYDKSLGKSRIGELFSTFLSVLVGSLFLFFVVILNDLPNSFHIYYILLFSLFSLQFIFTYSIRLLITQFGIRKIINREWVTNVLIIGAGDNASKIAVDLYQLGYEIMGFVSEDKETPIKVDANAVLGSVEDVPNLIATHRIDELVVALETDDNRKFLSILYPLYSCSLPIKVLTEKFNEFFRSKIKSIYGIPLSDVTDNNMHAVEYHIKELMDKLFSVIALLFLSPLFLYITWRIKRDSGGPVFYSQERIGYRGKPFRMYKFRTMIVGAEEDGPALSCENDNRITPYGKFLRKYRMDELPQFWNVLKGDMSLVGPRPERKYYIDQIVSKAPFYYLLHNIRPGITSLGMVKYGYAKTVDEMLKRLEYDVLYYENMSLILDITILIFTIKTVITGKGI